MGEDEITVQLRRARVAGDSATEERDRARAAAVLSIDTIEAAVTSRLAGTRILGLCNLGTNRNPVYAARVRGDHPDKPLEVGEETLVIHQSGRILVGRVHRAIEDERVLAGCRARLPTDVRLEDAELLLRRLAFVLDRHLLIADQRAAAFKAVSELCARITSVLL